MNLIHSDGMDVLPPFDTLIAFDATLRHRSVTSAAAELGLTQSAVSHRLRRLEGFLGIPVLRRSAAGIVPTPAGVALAEGLTELTGGLAGLRARCRAAVTPATLKVGVSAALADYWLVRRLPHFSARHSGIAIELVVIDDTMQAIASDLDVQVLWLPVSDVKPSSTQRLLFKESVFPVCHPQLLPDGRPLQDLAVFSSMPLLYKGAAEAERGTEWSWSLWFERLGLALAPRRGTRFAKISTAIAASMQRAGVVLARSLLVQDALAENRLCRVLPATWDMPSQKAHIVRWPAALTNDRRVRDFVTWLTNEAEQAQAA